MLPIETSDQKIPIIFVSHLYGFIESPISYQAGMQKIINTNPELSNKKFYAIYLSSTSAQKGSVGHYDLFEYDPHSDQKFTHHKISGASHRCGLNAILTAHKLAGVPEADELVISNESGYWGIKSSTTNPDFKNKFDQWLDKSLSNDALGIPLASEVVGAINTLATNITNAFGLKTDETTSPLTLSLGDPVKQNLKKRMVEISSSGIGAELEMQEMINFLSSPNSKLEYKEIYGKTLSPDGRKKFNQLIQYSGNEEKLTDWDIKFLDFSETSQDFVNSDDKIKYQNDTIYANIIDKLSKKFLEQIFAQEEPLEDDKKKKILAFCEKVEELIPHVLSGERKLSLEISVQKLKIAKEGGKKEITESLDFSKPYYEQQIFSQENRRFADLVEIPNQLLANPRGLTRKYGLDLDLDENSKTLTIAIIRDKPTKKEEEKKGVHGKVSEGDKITRINGITIADIIKKCQEKSINPRDEIARLFAMEESLKLVIARKDVETEITIGDNRELADKRMIDYGQSPNPKKKLSSVARILPTPATSSALTPSSTPTLLPKQARARTDVAGINPTQFGSDEIINKIQDFLKTKTGTDAGYQQELENFFKTNPGHCNDAQYKLEIVACSKMLEHIDSQFANMEKILGKDKDAIMLFAGNEKTERISFGNGYAIDQWQTNPLKPDSKDQRNMGILNKLIQDYINFKYLKLKDTRFKDRIKVGAIGTGYTKKYPTVRVEAYTIPEGKSVYHVFGANVENSNLPEGQKIEGGGQADSVSGPREQTFKTISLITTPVKCTTDNVDDITKPDPVHENMTKSPPHSPLPSPRHLPHPFPSNSSQLTSHHQAERSPL